MKLDDVGETALRIQVGLTHEPRKSHTRNRIPGTKCTEIAVSEISFRGVGAKLLILFQTLAGSDV
eukprot:3781033-Rhodomonas_salina.1